MLAGALMAQQGETADRIVRAREALPSSALGTIAVAVWLRRRWQSCRALVFRGRDWLLAWHQSAAEQRYLADLSDRDLRDIGLSRDEVVRESTQSFWRR
jgi:uncharacterized protein YjiS (DUF1127 family)